MSARCGVTTKYAYNIKFAIYSVHTPSLQRTILLASLQRAHTVLLASLQRAHTVLTASLQRAHTVLTASLQRAHTVPTACTHRPDTVPTACTHRRSQSVHMGYVLPLFGPSMFILKWLCLKLKIRISSDSTVWKPYIFFKFTSRPII